MHPPIQLNKPINAVHQIVHLIIPKLHASVCIAEIGELSLLLNTYSLALSKSVEINHAAYFYEVQVMGFICYMALEH